jgi:DNA-binding transcriptional LysR family regulator
VAPSLAASFLPGIIAAFTAEYPDVELKLYDVLADAAIEMVRAGAVDLALTPRRDDVDGLVQRDVLRDELVVLCAASHPFAGKRSLGWDDLRAGAHIARKAGSSTRRLIDQEYLRKGEVFRPTFEVENTGTMLGLIVAGLGFGIFPRSAIGSFNMTGLVCIPFGRAARRYRTISVVTLPSRAPTPAVEYFLRLCREKAGDQRVAPHPDPEQRGGAASRGE